MSSTYNSKQERKERKTGPIWRTIFPFWPREMVRTWCASIFWFVISSVLLSTLKTLSFPILFLPYPGWRSTSNTLSTMTFTPPPMICCWARATTSTTPTSVSCHPFVRISSTLFKDSRIHVRECKLVVQSTYWRCLLLVSTVHHTSSNSLSNHEGVI